MPHATRCWPNWLRRTARAVREGRPVVAGVDDLRHFARDNPPRAVSFGAELRDVAGRLGELPHGFPLVPRYERHGIRRRSWKGYGILYSALPDRVFVHRIVGPGQDHDRALGLS